MLFIVNLDPFINIYITEMPLALRNSPYEFYILKLLSIPRHPYSSLRWLYSHTNNLKKTNGSYWNIFDQIEHLSLFYLVSECIFKTPDTFDFLTFENMDM